MTSESTAIKLDRGQERLLAALRAEEKHCAALLDLTRTEHRALLENDVEAVADLLGRKAHLTRQISRAEAERAASAAEIAGRAGLGGSSVSLTELSGAFPEQARGELTSVQRSIRNKAAELAELNGRNAAMLRTSLDLLSRWVGFLIRSAGGATTYDEGGGHIEPGQAGALDRKA